MSPKSPDTRISPHFWASKLDDPGLDDVIDVFEDRVRFWLIEPARGVSGLEFGEFATISLLLMYFEGIWSYIRGDSSRSKSKRFFREGFVDVFRGGGLPEDLLSRIAEVFYEDARCGSFHGGMFRERIYFSSRIDGALLVTFPKVAGQLDTSAEIESIVVNPLHFFAAVEAHFGDLLEKLRDTNERNLRERFMNFCRTEWDWEGPPRVIGLEPSEQEAT